MKKENDIKQLKKHLKGWTKQQGINLTEEQYKIIFDLAGSLGIKDIGKMTIFYTMNIMPILETFVRGNPKQIEEAKLGAWAYQQDKLWKEGKLEKEKVEKLNKIGFPFGTYCK